MSVFAKGYIDEDYVFTAWTRAWVDDERDAQALYRAQEHITIAFVLDPTVPHGKAWRCNGSPILQRWRINPSTLDDWETAAAKLDWRHNELTAEDYYAA